MTVTDSKLETYINALTEDTTPDTSADMLMEYDASATGMKKLKLATLASYLSTGPAADGWAAASGSWSYASATTITVPSGAAALYAVGDKIKWTQTSVHYGYIVTVADTLLTVVGDAVANAAISANYYSHQTSPIGFPQWFAWTPSLTIGDSDLSGYDTARFSIVGRNCHFFFLATSKTMSGSAGTSKITLPVTAASDRAYGVQCMLYYSGIGAGYIVTMASISAASANLEIFKDNGGGNFTAGETAVSLRITGVYEI